ARAGEKLTTLDGKRRELTGEILVIADRDRPVAVAGVMGGADTEVSESSTRLLLECAWFDPRRVRRGARALGLAPEASKRFERGVDPAIGARDPGRARAPRHARPRAHRGLDQLDGLGARSPGDRAAPRPG